MNTISIRYDVIANVLCPICRTINPYSKNFISSSTQNKECVACTDTDKKFVWLPTCCHFDVCCDCIEQIIIKDESDDEENEENESDIEAEFIEDDEENEEDEEENSDNNENDNSDESDDNEEATDEDEIDEADGGEYDEIINISYLFEEKNSAESETEAEAEEIINISHLFEANEEAEEAEEAEEEIINISHLFEENEKAIEENCKPNSTIAQRAIQILDKLFGKFGYYKKNSDKSELSSDQIDNL